MYKKIISKAKIFFLAAIIALFFYYIKKYFHNFRHVLSLRPLQLSVISGFTLAGIALEGYVFRVLLKGLDVSLAFKEWFGLTVINRFSNYLFAKSGPVVRGAYLKKIHNFSYKKTLAVMFIFAGIQVSSAAIVFALSIIAKLITESKFGVSAFLFTAFLILSPYFLFIIYKKYIRGIDKMKNITGYLDEWGKEEKIGVIFKSFALSVLIILLYSLKLSYLYNAVFHPLPYPTILLVTSAGIISFAVSITPASLGIREMVMSYAAKLSNENFVDAVTITSFDRIITIFWILALAAYFNFWYYRVVNDKKEE